MEILSSIIGTIIEYTVKPVGRQLGYLCFINNNINKLHCQVEMLKETKETVQRMVSNAIRNVEDIKPDVQSWLTKVDAIIEKSDNLLPNEEGQQLRLCLNLVQRHKLSRKAVKMAEEVVGLKNEGNNFDTVSLPYAPLWVPSPTNKSDFLKFESRNSTVEQIRDVLSDDNINKIGIYGMGGVGKTMLVKEISRTVKEKKLFDEVVISTISHTPDLKSIQVQLAEKLGLTLEQETVEGRALKLQKRLKMEKRILVVLDDIWDHIDLEAIGIPSVENHKGCKILLTARDKHILSNDMCTDRDFEIKVLEEHEALLLFKKMAGETVETSDLKPITIEIVKECSHLPLAITTVAKALRSKSTPIWKDALNQLRNPVVGNIRGMEKKVYSSLKLSYEHLECQDAKLLFLLCSMFPEDFLIDLEMLHIYAMGMDFLQGVDTVAQGRHRTGKLVDDLLSSSLLQSEYFLGDSYVKMHDIVRDVAISIAREDDKIHTLSHVKKYLNEGEEEKLSGTYTAAYLQGEGLLNPQQKLMLPKVQLLILRGSIMFNKQELSQTFFDEMKELKVLELQLVKILQLPTSLDSFANIRSLRLIYCELENIDMIGDLNKLEILSLEGSNITKIPTSIRQLTKLKVLDLSECDLLKEIPPNILSRLTKLEELYLEDFKEWEREELNEGRKNASVSELKYLSNLSILAVCIPDENIMPKQLFSRELNLENFNITIGAWGSSTNSCRIWSMGKLYKSWYMGEVYKTRFMGKPYRKLRLDIDLESSMDDWIKMLLKRTQQMELVGSISIRIFFSELDENETLPVTRLYLSNNSELQYFIHEQKKPLRKSLSNLEDLHLDNLQNLESVIHGNIRESPFNKLRFVKVCKCNKLKSLFFKSTLDELLNFEDIYIHSCETVEEIIAIESGETTNKIELTRLKCLYLYSLPRLQKFSSEIHEFGQSSLDNSEKIGESKFSNDGSLFSGKVSFPNLKELYIGGANNLEKVFPSNIMIMLTCLETLRIEDCKLLERVFELQETDVTKRSDALLPSLRKLALSNLPNLEYVWSKHPWELEIFENVQDLTIYGCPKFKGALIKVFQRLENLKIDLGDFKNIIEKERSVQMQEMDQINAFKGKTIQLRDGLELFMKLKWLNLIGNFDYKSTHLPMEIVLVLHSLETLEMESTFIEEIIPNERLIDVEDHQNARSGAVNILVPSLVSFKILIYLSVHTCYRLTHLFNPSVATTLVQLTSLNIENCKRMTTIIVGRAEEENDEIIFKKLKYISLSHLSKLISFHSGKCIIKFPCLGHLYTKNCPEMKVFSLGIVSTPLLHLEDVDLYCDNECFVTKDSEDIFVKDINVIVKQAWEKYYDINIQYLFINQNLEEDQLNHSSSQVEELESD